MLSTLFWCTRSWQNASKMPSFWSKSCSLMIQNKACELTQSEGLNQTSCHKTFLRSRLSLPSLAGLKALPPSLKELRRTTHAVPLHFVTQATQRPPRSSASWKLNTEQRYKSMREYWRYTTWSISHLLLYHPLPTSIASHPLHLRQSVVDATVACCWCEGCVTYLLNHFSPLIAQPFHCSATCSLGRSPQLISLTLEMYPQSRKQVLDSARAHRKWIHGNKRGTYRNQVLNIFGVSKWV